MPHHVHLTAEEFALPISVRIFHNLDSRVRDRQDVETHTLTICISPRIRRIARPERSLLVAKRVRIVGNDEASPVVRHDLRQGLVICRRPNNLFGEEKGLRRRVRFGSGVQFELEFIDELAAVCHRGGHFVGRALDDEVAEPRLPLKEGRVVGGAGM